MVWGRFVVMYECTINLRKEGKKQNNRRELPLPLPGGVKEQ